MRGYGIDLGTATTLVAHQHRGIVFEESTVMLVRTDRHGKRVDPVLVGGAARSLVGRCPAGVAPVHPLHDGVITDLDTTRAYLSEVLGKVGRRVWPGVRPHAVIGVPAGATSLERRALVEAASDAGLRRPRLLPQTIAGALGCGIDPLEPRAHLVVDVGAGTAEVTAFCYGGVLSHRTCRVAGDEMTLALFRYLRSEHQMIVGETATEYVKCQAAAEPTTSIVARGVDAASGRPRLVTLGVDEVVDAIRPTTDAILDTLVNCLEDLPPQAVYDIFESGVIAFGGGVLMHGFDKLLEDAFAFPVRLADSPETCVAEGLAATLSRADVLRTFDGELVQPV